MGVEIWGLTLSGSGETAARAMPAYARLLADRRALVVSSR
jgi:hypothetical protein